MRTLPVVAAGVTVFVLLGMALQLAACATSDKTAPAPHAGAPLACDTETIKAAIKRAEKEQRDEHDALDLADVAHCDGDLVATVMQTAFRGSESAFAARGSYYDAVLAVAQQQALALQRCYEQQLAEQPELSGRIEIELTIEAEGRVEAANILVDHLASDSLITCLRTEVTTWSFPAPQDPPVIVEIPLEFSALPAAQQHTAAP